jgi:O-antigen/teichoic acid export membrane protein
MIKTLLKNKNIKDSVLYTAGNYFFRISLLISNLISSRILGPSITGVITYINAIDQNINIGYSTIRASLEREIPKLNANNETVEAQRFASSSFMLSYLMFIVGSIFYATYSLITTDYYIKITCIFFICINFIKALSDLIRVYHKSLYSFTSITLTLFIVSLIQPFLVYFIVNKYFYVGFLWTRVFLYGTSVLLLIFLLKKYPKIIFDFDFQYFKRLFAVGLPIVIFGLIMTVLVTIDKFYIKHSLGDSMLGYYSIGALIYQVLSVFPESMYGSYFPKFITYKGNQEKQINKLSLLIRITIIPIIIVAWICIPPFVTLILPKFQSGIFSAKILIVSIYFSASYQMYYYEIIRLNKFKRLLIGSGLVLLFSTGLYTLVMYFFTSIEQYAFANILVFMFFAFYVIAIAMKEMGKNNMQIIKKLGNEIIMIYPLLLVLSVDFFFDYSYKIEIMKFFLFIVLYLPMFLKHKEELLNFILKKQ